MKKKSLLRLIGILAGLAVISLSIMPASFAGGVPKITKEELQKIISDSDVVILDVRQGKDWKFSEFKIKGAIRENPNKLDAWVAEYPKDKRFILYCA